MARRSPPNKFVFIGGVPRSGTTWTQLLLSQHDLVVSGRETHALGRHIKDMLKIYDDQAANSPDGMHTLVNRKEFVKTFVGPFLKSTMKAIASQDENARVVLEKTPRNIELFRAVDAIYGNRARMLAVVRDPRAVCASWQRAAAEDWGEWARKPLKQTMTRWVNTSKRIANYEKLLGNRFKTVRYEDLLANPERELSDMLTWIGLDHSASEVEKMVANTDIKALISNAPHVSGENDPSAETRKNFFRKGVADGWKSELSETQIQEIEEIAGKAMVKFGYALSDPASGRKNDVA